MSGRLKDGIIKRGRTWACVVRVPDPETGKTRPIWIGGFETEDAAKAARDQARVEARRGEYVDRDAITVRHYLLDWLDGDAASVKPKTLSNYRYQVEHYVIPRIGGQRLQALRPATVSKLYRDLSTSGGRDGRPLSASTVATVHRSLTKALNDAVNVDQLIGSNPCVRAKRPRLARHEVGRVWSADKLRAFLAVAETHRLFAFFHLSA